MSEENVELVRRTFDSFNSGDLDRMLEGIGEDFEADWSNSIGPLKGVYRGREGVLTFWRSFLDAWESVRWNPAEIIEVDDARVIVVNQVSLRGRGSGAEVKATGVQLWTIENGTARRVKLYQSKADAMKAVRLET